MLNESEIAHYHQHGFVMPRFQMPDAVIESIKREHTALVQANPHYIDYCPALLDIAPVFLEYCLNPTIIELVSQLIGPDVALWNASFFAKPALKGKRTPWHQDGEYWPITPLATCTVWLAVDDSNRENGCLRVIRGSHRERSLRRHHQVHVGEVTLTQALDASEFDETQAVDLVLKAGQISLHDVFLLHGSEPNQSSNPRRGMTMRFMPTSSLFDRELAKRKALDMNIVDHSNRPVYLVRGEDRHGKNKFFKL
ncbi:MAG: phytanoyl-CoA dioxygenase family protein [Betaproteobacteria bacterium]|nr:phytanoyl-CoA dioxygenase family protein [Betaproteobacteria bacterium]